MEFGEILTLGRVGIGTKTPAAGIPLHVYDSKSVAGTAYPLARFGNANTGHGIQIEYDYNNAGEPIGYIVNTYTTAGSDIKIGFGAACATEVAISIANGTGVGIGGNPVHKFDVFYSGTDYASFIYNSSSSANIYGIQINFPNKNPTGGYFIGCTDSGGYEAYVTGTGFWTNVSDLRVKDVDGETASKLDDILALTVIDYTRKNDASLKPHIGVTAQDLEEKPGFAHLVTTLSSEENEGKGERKMIYKAGMIPIILKGLQELTVEVRERLDALEKV